MASSSGEEYEKDDATVKEEYVEQGDFSTKETSLKSTKEEKTSIVPSTIFNKKYIYYPEKYEKEMPQNKNAGKWLLFAQTKDKVDERWGILKSLCDNGILTAIKSSTAGNEFSIGITICYTSNAENKQEVKKAADAIRTLINHEYVIYYKTNKSTMDGQYQHLGKKDISLFAHCVKGHLYEKDQYMRWFKVLD